MTECKIITSTERRRRWSSSEKKQMVLETYSPGVSVSQIARKYGITPSQLFYWRRLMENGGLKGIESQEELVPKSQIKALEKHIRELERALGKKTLQVEILQEGYKIAKEKKLLLQQLSLDLIDTVSD